jgi:hypothetical protein
MPKRNFDTWDLIKWNIHNYYDCEIVKQVNHLGMRKFEEEIEIIFEAPDDKKLWSITIERNSGAGYNSITGISYGYKIEPEQKFFVGEEVLAKEVTMTVYEIIKDK